MLHHLQAPHHIALGVRQRLALLVGDVLGDVLEVLFDQVLELEHDLLPGHRRGLRPGLEGLRAAVDGRFHFVLGAHWNVADKVVCSWVVQVYPFVGL